MDEQLDLRGMLCPEPVLATKKVLDKPDTQQVEALVDDDVCVSNLQRLARSIKASCAVAEREGHFAVTISKSGAAHRHDNQGQSSSPATAITLDVSNDKRTSAGTVVFISSDQFGKGDPEFSQTLLNVFLQSLFEAGHRPRAIMMANSGVKLMAADSSARKVLQDFRDAGCEVLACGLCVDYYGLKQDIPKEQITNMFAICEYLNAAEKIIQP